VRVGVIPDEFVGAWERISVSLDGSVPAEPATVIWLQGRSAFADLRLPRDDVHAPDLPYGTGSVERCFAGHARFEPPNLRWSHTIDLAGVLADKDDVGYVRWDNGDLVEEGTFLIDGIAVEYVEVWHKLPDCAGRVVEITDRGFVHVEVGDHALTIDDKRSAGGSFLARYQRRGDLVLSYGPNLATAAGQ
jgi:hypothetical protein